MKANRALQPLGRLVGTWRTLGKHPYFPGRTFHGRASFEWIESGAFLVMRTRINETESGIPSGVAIFGTDDADDACFMLYFDERGVARKYDVAIDEHGVTWTRDAPGFSQRFRVTLARDGRSMEGRGEMSKDGATWEKDLDLDYTRTQETSSSAFEP